MIRRNKWWLRELERINRANDRRVDELLVVVAHLAGKPLPVQTERVQLMQPEESRLVASPEQLPEEAWE